MTYGVSLFIKAANQMCYQVLQGLHLCPEYQEYSHGEVFWQETSSFWRRWGPLKFQNKAQEGIIPLWSIGSISRLKINCGMQWFHQLHVERKEWIVANSSMMRLKIWEEFGGRWCHLNCILLQFSFSVTSHIASTTVSKAHGLTKAPPVVLGNVISNCIQYFKTDFVMLQSKVLCLENFQDLLYS